MKCQPVNDKRMEAIEPGKKVCKFTKKKFKNTIAAGDFRTIIYASLFAAVNNTISFPSDQPSLQVGKNYTKLSLKIRKKKNVLEFCDAIADHRQCYLNK
jgi:hypothetical protein